MGESHQIPLVGLLPQQHPDQRGLARAVAAVERGAVAAAEREACVFKQHAAAEALGQVFGFQHALAVGRFPLKAEVDVLFRFRLRLAVLDHALQALDVVFDLFVHLLGAGAGGLLFAHLQAVGRLFRGLAVGDLGAAAHGGDVLFQRLAALLALRPAVHAGLKILRLLLAVVAVTAPVFGEFSLFQFENAIHGLVEKIAVVGDDEHRAVEVAQALDQVAHGIEIEVVGRLVEQQQRRAAGERFGNRRAGALPAGERFRAAQVRLLMQQAHGGAVFDAQRAGIGRDLARDEPQQRGFARAVRPDEPHALAALQDKG